MSGHHRARRSEDWEQAATWPTHHDPQVSATRQRSMELDRALRRRSRDIERGAARPAAVELGAVVQLDLSVAAAPDPAVPASSTDPAGPPEAVSA